VKDVKRVLILAASVMALGLGVTSGLLVAARDDGDRSGRPGNAQTVTVVTEYVIDPVQAPCGQPPFPKCAR
jgi:hypothetical protein